MDSLSKCRSIESSHERLGIARKAFSRFFAFAFVTFLQNLKGSVSVNWL